MRSAPSRTATGRARWSWLAAVPGVVFLLAFALYPLLSLLRNALGIGRTGLREDPGFTLDFFLRALESPTIRQSMINSVVVCVSAVSVAIALSVPLVLYLARRSRDGHGTALVDSTFTLPVALPGTIIGFFAVVLLGNTGLLGAWIPALSGTAYVIPGLVVAYTYFSLPRIISPLRGAAENLDPAMAETARTLGAGRVRVFLTVTLPMLLPAIIESSGTALAVALGGYGTIAVLSRGERLLPLDVVDSLSAAGFNIAYASATAIVLAVLAVAFLVVGRTLAALVRRRLVR